MFFNPTSVNHRPTQIKRSKAQIRVARNLPTMAFSMRPSTLGGLCPQPILEGRFAEVIEPVAVLFGLCRRCLKKVFAPHLASFVLSDKTVKSRSSNARSVSRGLVLRGIASVAAQGLLTPGLC